MLRYLLEKCKKTLTPVESSDTKTVHNVNESQMLQHKETEQVGNEIQTGSTIMDR